MYNYFYSDNGTQKGPVNYEGLKKAGISKDTLVWRDGLEDWVKAGELEELVDCTFPEKEEENVLVERIESATSNFTEEICERDNTKMFKNAFLFRGRARRTELWIMYAAGYLGMMVPFFTGELFDDSLFQSSLISSIVGAASIIVCIAGYWLILSESTRRCHDLGHNGFWQLIPYYIFWLLFQDSKPGSNKYGNTPKGEN